MTLGERDALAAALPKLELRLDLEVGRRAAHR